MKNNLKLSLWLLLAALAVPLVPTMAIAQADKRMQQLRFRKNYLDAKALYEKRQREGASPAELQKLEKEMKQARNKWIGVVLGIATAAVAATGAAAYAGTSGKAQDPLIVELTQNIKNKSDDALIKDIIEDIMGSNIGSNINTTDAQGMTALHYAAQQGRSKIVGSLITKLNADVKVHDRQGRTPLMLYVASENPDNAIITLLKKYGADTKAKDRKGHTAADYYANNFEKRGAFSDIEIMNLLIP